MLNILLIEDEEMVATSTAKLLERKGHRVTIHNNGVGWFELIGEINPDLVITDHNLGRGDKGLDIAETCRALNRKVLLMSGSIELEDVAISMNIPFICKGELNKFLLFVEKIDNLVK